MLSLRPFWTSTGILALLLCANTVFAEDATLQVVTPATSSPERPVSRLSRLALNQDTLYLPNRLMLGEENRFLIKGKPGSEVMLYISPKNNGYELPNGLKLRIGDTHESLGGKIPENGILSLTVPVPNEGDWEGHYLFVDAITWTDPSYSDVKQIQMLDSTGRRTVDNGLVMAKAGKSNGGSLIMPSMPGVPAGALQQLTQMSQIMSSGDTDRKKLIDDGERNTDTLLDRNSLLNRPGFGTSPLK